MRSVLEIAKEASQGEPISTKLCNDLVASAWTPFLEKNAALIRADVIQMVEVILKGIDETQNEWDGWWSTSTGAKFGKEILDQIRKLK